VSKEKFEEKMDILKTTLVERFNSLTDYSELEVERWLVSYVKKMKVWRMNYTNFQLTLEV
jgi:hypothetical protein